MKAPQSFLTRISSWSGAALSLMPGRRDRGESGSLDSLQGLGQELGILCNSTEGEFLAVGESLHHFYMRAKEISKLSSSVAGLMSGEEVGQTIEGFRSFCDRIRKIESESAQSTDILRHVLSILWQMGTHLDGFRKTVRVLRVLCVSTRIESARLGSRDIGFSTLADDVDKLVLEIETKCAHLSDQTESLRQLIQDSLARVLDMEARQQKQARLILDSTLSSLVDLTEKHAMSSTSVMHISKRYESISRNIGEIVAAMQFHDITRQRIEHVKEAIEELEGGSPDGGEPRPDAREGEKETRWGAFRKGKDGRNGKRERAESRWKELHRRADICELQAAQLRYAKDELMKAVANIIRNLHGIGGHVEEISQETQKMAGAADEAGRSFLSELEKGVSSILAALAGYAQATGELSSAMDSVARTLGDMSAFASDIENIGTKIKLIALNAIVKACHMGDEGAALAVLAEDIHSLSIDTCQRTATVCEVLRSITADADVLSTGFGGEMGSKVSELDGMGETLQHLLQSLQSVNDRIVTHLSRIDEEGHTLSEDINRGIESFTVHERIDAVVTKVSARLDEIVARSRAEIPAPHRLESTSEHMKALEAAYTMQGEREIHQSILKSGTLAAGAAAATLTASVSDTAAEVILFDDDPSIELFDQEEDASVELFDQETPPSSESASPSEGVREEESDDDLGDNVELF